MGKKTKENNEQNEKKSCILKYIEIFLAVVEIAITIFLGIVANDIQKNQETISRKSEPLIYEVIGEIKSLQYQIEERPELKIDSYAPVIIVKQGVIDVLKVIKYNGKDLKILGQPNEKMMEKYRLSDNVLEMKVEQNLTDVHNNKLYDYFFVYIKSGDGLEHLDLIYTEINLKKGGKASKPKLKTKIDILDNSNKDLGYLEMMDSYKKIIENIDKILEGELQLY